MIKIEGRQVTDSDIGAPVTYIPSHAKGDINHEDAEHGIISSFNEVSIWVKYDGHNGQNTPARYLIWR